MKDYDRFGGLKKEKRKFEVIINSSIKGIYSDFTPIKVAKKVTSELSGKNKNIIFHLQEKGNNGKKYGPYIGNIQAGKIVVRIYKMKGGKDNDYDWNKADGFLQTSFLRKCKYDEKNNINRNDPFKFQFKIISGEPTLTLGIFGEQIITFSGAQYLPYFFYILGDELKFHKISISSDGKNLVFTPISDNKLDKSIIDSLIKLFLSEQFSEKYSRNNQGNDKKTFLVTKFVSMFYRNQQQPNSSSNDIWNFKNELVVKKTIDGITGIFFGFNENTSQYKYQYDSKDLKSNHFYIKDNKNLDKPISIDEIPIYDILTLDEFNNNSNPVDQNLKNLLEKRISDAQKKISLTGEEFFRLGNTNFTIEKNKNNNINSLKNLAKVKRRRIFKTTYIFFGKNKITNKFEYVCFREGNNVFYYSRDNLKTAQKLENLKDIRALKDLVTFILLRRLSNTKDKKFADIILDNAKTIIKNRLLAKKQNISSSLQKFPQFSSKNNNLKFSGIFPSSPQRTSISTF